MVPGDPGNSGPNAPRPVGEDLKFAPGVVTLQSRHMVEMVARGNLQSQHPATHTSVSRSSIPVGRGPVTYFDLWPNSVCL